MSSQPDRPPGFRGAVLLSAAVHSCGMPRDRLREGRGRVIDAVAQIGGTRSRREVTVGIITWIVLGAIAGFITDRLMGGASDGAIATILLGIIGAIVGGFVAGTVLGVADVTGINISSIIVAVIGAVIVVAAY